MEGTTGMEGTTAMPILRIRVLPSIKRQLRKWIGLKNAAIFLAENLSVDKS